MIKMRFLVLFLAYIVCFNGVSSATTWYVGTSDADFVTDGIDDQIEVTLAMENASNGDTIQFNGTGPYTFNGSGISGSSINITKELTLKGEYSTTVLTNVYKEQWMIKTSAPNITIYNFTINTTHTTRNVSAAIGIYDNSHNIEIYNIYSKIDDYFSFKYGITSGSKTATAINNIKIHDIQMARGIKLQYADYAYINNIDLNGSYQTPPDYGGTVGMLEINKEVHDLQVVNSTIDYCSNSAIYFHSGNGNNTIENVTASGGSTAVILIDDPNRDIYIYNSTVENSDVGVMFNFLAGDYAINTTIKNTIFKDLNTGIKTDKDGDITNLTIQSSNIININNNSIELFSGVNGFTLENSILYNWGNTDYAITTISNISGNSIIQYNNIYDPDNSTKYNNSVSTNTILTNPNFYDLISFRLNSTTGTWNGTGWELMSQDSPAIDAGNPTDDYSKEPSPNGNRINIGVYGNTPYASKSSWNVDDSPYLNKPCNTYSDGSISQNVEILQGDTSLNNIFSMVVV